VGSAPGLSPFWVVNDDPRQPATYLRIAALAALVERYLQAFAGGSPLVRLVSSWLGVSRMSGSPRWPSWVVGALGVAILVGACTTGSHGTLATSSSAAVPSPTASATAPTGIHGYRVVSVDCHRRNSFRRYGPVTGVVQSYVFCAPRRGFNLSALVPFEVTSASPWFPALTRVLAISNIKTPKDTVCPAGPYIWYPPLYVRTSDGIWIARLPTGVCGQVRPVVAGVLFHMVRTRNR